MRRLGVLLGLATTATFAPACVAFGALEALGEAPSPILSDGSRWAAWEGGPGDLRVIDDHDRVSRDLRTDDGCQPHDVAFGRALLICPYGSSTRPAVIDLRTGAQLGPPMERAGRSGWVPGDRWDQLGRYWLFGSIITMRGDRLGYYLNWRTGRYVRDDGRRRDIDDPRQPVAPECDRRSRGKAFIEDRPAMLRRYGGPDRRYLLLSRCGERRPHRLSRCPGGCPSVSLAGGVVSWAEGASGDVARAFVISSRRSLSWRVPAFDARHAGVPLVVRHTRRTVFLSAFAPSSAPGQASRYTLYEASLPSG